MTPRLAVIAVAVVLLGVLAVVVIKRSAPPDEPAPEAVEGEAPAAEIEVDPDTLQLYFPGSGGWLIPEERTLEGLERPDLLTIAELVLAGPTSPGLYAPFPDDTRVGGVFISANRVAYVDLTSTRPNPPSSGSRDEMLSVYSLVNSIHANVPDLAGVVLLWNGQQRPTFAGHLDTGRPLLANRSLVTRR